MCLNKKERFVTSRTYLYLYCNRYTSFHSNKTIKETLRLDVKNDKGEISFILVDKTTNKKEVLNNPKTDIYSFPLEKDHKYLIEIHANGACGHYIFKRIREIDD